MIEENKMNSHQHQKNHSSQQPLSSNSNSNTNNQNDNNNNNSSINNTSSLSSSSTPLKQNTPKVQISKLNLNQIHNPYHNCSISIIDNQNQQQQQQQKQTSSKQQLSQEQNRLQPINENKEQQSPLFTRKNFFNINSDIASSSSNSHDHQQQCKNISNNCDGSKIYQPFMTQEYESINLNSNSNNNNENRDTSSIFAQSTQNGDGSSRISRLRKGSLPLPSLHSYRERKIKGGEEMGLTKKEFALQQRNARHFWGTMLIPGVDILKNDLVQVKEESDSRLLLFIADVRRQLRVTEQQKTSSSEKELLGELLRIANSFLALKPNQIECGKYAEELLKTLNEKDLQGKTRDLVVNLLFIISNFGRIQELLAIENEKKSNQDDLLSIKGLMNPLATPPASPQNSPRHFNPPSYQAPPPPQQPVQKERLLPPNYNQNSPSVLNSPMGLSFNKSHFRTLSYSPKCLSPPFESDDEGSITTTASGSEQITNNDGSIMDSTSSISSSSSESLGAEDTNNSLRRRTELKRPSPLSQPGQITTSTTNNLHHQPTIQPPLLSRRIVDLISSDNSKLFKQPEPIRDDDFIPVHPISPELSTPDKSGKPITSEISSTKTPTTAITEQPRILDQSHFLEELDTFSTSSEEEDEDYTSSSEEESDDEEEVEKTENENHIISSHADVKNSISDNSMPTTNQMMTMKKSITNPRLDNLKSMTTTDPITKRPLVRSKSFSPNKFKESKKQTIGRRKLTRSFSEIPSISVLETDVQQQMAMCRICEEKINSSLLEEHSKICAMANKEDMKAMNVEDQLRAIAKILLTRSQNVPPEKRKQLQEFREIAQQAVELGMRDCFKMIIVIKEKLKRMDPNDENIPLARKIELLINEKINALRTAEEVINSSPRIFRTSYPRVMISPRNADVPNFFDFKLTGGRNRSDSDPTQTRQSILDSNRPKGIPTIDDFQIIKPITKGGFGKVYLAKKKRTGDIYAIKRLKKSDMVKKNQVNHVKIERDILAHTSNPYVVKMYYSFQSRDYLYLVMEYVHGGDCFSLLQNLGALDEDMAKMIIAETVLALEYLHSLGIIHRDLKPDNLLIDKNGHIKLTDFGLSKIGLLDRQTVVPPTIFSNSSGNNASSSSPKLPGVKKPLPLSLTKKLPYALSSPSVALSQNNTYIPLPPPPIMHDHLDQHRTPAGRDSPPIFNPITNTPPSHGKKDRPLVAQQLPGALGGARGGVVGGTAATTTTTDPNSRERKLSCVGTPDYLAPEILLGGIGHSKAVDWFAVGVILYEFLTGLPPFTAQTVEGTFQNILHRKIKWTDDISDEARDLIDKLLALNPQSRLGYNGAEEVKAHPFFNGINWSTIRTQKPFFVPVLEDLQDTSYFDARKQFYDLRISDDDNANRIAAAGGGATMGNAAGTSGRNTPNSNTASLTNSSGGISNDSKFDDFLYVNFQSLSELNHNYLIETNPYVISRRRNSF